MKCTNDICPQEAVAGSEFCVDHMPESEARDRLAQTLDEMKAREASYMDRLDKERDTEEQIVLARAKQDYEKTAGEEYAEIEGKVVAKAEQARIQGEIRELAFRDRVRHPDNPREDIFLERKYLNRSLRTGEYCLSMNGVDWPVKPDAMNNIPHQFAYDYRSKMNAIAYLERVKAALSVGSYDIPPGQGDFKTQGEYEFLLQKARHGKL